MQRSLRVCALLFCFLALNNDMLKVQAANAVADIQTGSPHPAVVEAIESVKQFVANNPSVLRMASGFAMDQEQASNAANMGMEFLQKFMHGVSSHSKALEESSSLVQVEAQRTNLFATDCDYTAEKCPSQKDVEAANNHASKVSLFAAIATFVGFLLLQVAVRGNKGTRALFSVLANISFLVGSALWVRTFSVLMSLILKAPGPFRWKDAIPTGAKLIGSYLFTLQPMTSLLSNDSMGGLPFSNLFGTIFFHFGNMMTVMDTMQNSFDYSNWQSTANLPYYGFIMFFLATALLLSANFVVYYGQHMTRSYPRFALPALQLAGSLLLIAGSAMFLIK